MTVKVACPQTLCVLLLYSKLGFFSMCVFISCNGHKDCMENIKGVINSSDGIHALS